MASRGLPSVCGVGAELGTGQEDAGTFDRGTPTAQAKKPGGRLTGTPSARRSVLLKPCLGADIGLKPHGL